MRKWLNLIKQILNEWPQFNWHPYSFDYSNVIIRVLVFNKDWRLIKLHFNGIPFCWGPIFQFWILVTLYMSNYKEVHIDYFHFQNKWREPQWQHLQPNAVIHTSQLITPFLSHSIVQSASPEGGFLTSLSILLRKKLIHWKMFHFIMIGHGNR